MYRLLAQQYGEVKFAEVHYQKLTVQLQQSSCSPCLMLFDCGADLDGYDASGTISYGPLTVIPQPWLVPAGQGMTILECYICKSGNQVPKLYVSRKVIHDKRTAEVGQLPATQRCAHCLQVACSIPCVWSWEWSQLHGMDLEVRGVEDPANSIDHTAGTHVVESLYAQVTPEQASYISRMEASFSSVVANRTRRTAKRTANVSPSAVISRSEADLGAPNRTGSSLAVPPSNTTVHEGAVTEPDSSVPMGTGAKTSVGPVGVVGNSPVVTVASTGDHLLPGRAVNSSPLTVTGGKAC